MIAGLRRLRRHSHQVAVRRSRCPPARRSTFVTTADCSCTAAQHSVAEPVVPLPETEHQFDPTRGWRDNGLPRRRFQLAIRHEDRPVYIELLHDGARPCFSRPSHRLLSPAGRDHLLRTRRAIDRHSDQPRPAGPTRRTVRPCLLPRSATAPRAGLERRRPTCDPEPRNPKAPTRVTSWNRSRQKSPRSNSDSDPARATSSAIRSIA